MCLCRGLQSSTLDSHWLVGLCVRLACLCVCVDPSFHMWSNLARDFTLTCKTLYIYIFQLFCRWRVMGQGKDGDLIRDQIREFRRFLHRIFSRPTLTFKWHPQVKRFEMRGPRKRLHPTMLARWPSHVHLYPIASYCPL